MWYFGEGWDAAWNTVVPASSWASGTAIERIVNDFFRPVFDIGAPFAGAALAVLLLSGILLLFAGLLLTPFGSELVVMGLSFDISGEATPLGDVYPMLMVPAVSPERPHSLHESPQVRKTLARWIAQLPAPATGPGARHFRIVGEKEE
jgi:hypothetical protein